MINTMILMATLGLFLGIVLGFANHFFTKKPDRKFEIISGLLPGINCGGCGLPGCDRFVRGLLVGEITTLASCRPCKVTQKKQIVNYLNSQQTKSGTFYQVTID